MNQKAINQLQQLRSDLHEFAFVTNKKLRSGREVSIAHTALQEAAMFTGTCIKEINDGKTPYVNSEDPFNTIIDKFHVDENVVPMTLPEDWDSMEYVQKVKWMRLMLGLTETKFKILLKDAGFLPVWAINPLTFAQMNIVRAKHWLGMELGRLRDSGL